jgi:hypothetical protein
MAGVVRASHLATSAGSKPFDSRKPRYFISWPQRTPWEAASCSDNQEFPNILWNSKVCYCVHDSHPLVPTLSRINPVHTTRLILTRLLLGIFSGLFLSGFPTQMSPHSCPSHPPWLEHSDYTSVRVRVSKLLDPSLLNPSLALPSLYHWPFYPVDLLLYPEEEDISFLRNVDIHM